MVSVAMVSVSEKLKQKKDQYSARGKYVWIATHTVKLKRLACSQENQESRPQSICFGIKLTSENVCAPNFPAMLVSAKL